MEPDQDYTHILSLIERFAAKFPEARKDRELLGVSVKSVSEGQANLILNVRASGCEQYRARHNLPGSFAMDPAEGQDAAALALNVSIEIQSRPVLAPPQKPSRRFSAG